MRNFLVSVGLFVSSVPTVAHRINRNHSYMRRFLYFLLLSAIPCRLRAETPPCGIAVIQTEGPKIGERFVAAPPEQVKVAVLKALPALASKLHKDEGFHLEAETDKEIYFILKRMNKDSGVRGMYSGLGAFGTLRIDIREATQDEVKGSLLHIEFHKNAFVGRMGKEGYPQPLAEETVCLVKLLSTNDPATNPRGLESKDIAPPRAVALPEGTPLKVLLRDPLYSKQLAKDSAGQAIQFEVAEDLVVDGVAVVRRGALVTGHFTKIEMAKVYGRHGEVQFVFDTATAVDGQKIPVTGADEKARGGRHNDTAATFIMSPALGWIAKGNEAFIRAGTAYDVEISGQHTVQTGH